ncbi:MAG: CBS domain-containing protein [Clostridia bacterium]|nr:CBS domain-containing protein [Clostridia bacterium]
MLVEEFMKREVITIGREDSVHVALGKTKEHRIRHLPVVEGERLVGIVSDRDLRDVSPSNLLQAQDIDILKSTKVKDIMKCPVLTAHPLDGIEEVARVMYEYKIGCLPVVKSGKLVGIVTETDILRILVELVGTLEPGTTLEIQVPDRPGALAEVTLAIKKHGVNLCSVLMRNGYVPNTRLITAKLQTKNVSAVIEDIEQLGFKVLFPYRRV